MEHPSEDFRAWVAGRLDEIDNEDQLDEVLEAIAGEAERAVEAGIGESAEDDLAAIDAWAGVASYGVARFYGPASPWPRNLAGWGARAVRRLRQVANILLTPLQAVAGALGAKSWSVGVGFPWGVSIGLSWQ